MVPQKDPELGLCSGTYGEQGDHLLRFLEDQEGRENVLRHLPDGETIVWRLARSGPGYPQMTADELEMDFEYVRHLYRALRRVGLLTEYEGSTIKANKTKSRDAPQPYLLRRDRRRKVDPANARGT